MPGTPTWNFLSFIGPSLNSMLALPGRKTLVLLSVIPDSPPVLKTLVWLDTSGPASPQFHDGLRLVGGRGDERGLLLAAPVNDRKGD